MERALCEALQSRFGLNTLLDQDPQACEDIFPGRELGGLNRALFWANPRNQSLITNLTDRYTRVAFSDLEDFSTTQEKILQELSARDWDLYEVDITAPFLEKHGYAVKKLICPQLLQGYCFEASRPLHSEHYGKTQFVRGAIPHPYA